MGWDSLELNSTNSERGACCVISAAASRATVRVIRTDEEWMIAKTVCRVLALAATRKNES